MEQAAAKDTILDALRVYTNQIETLQETFLLTMGRWPAQLFHSS